MYNYDFKNEKVVYENNNIFISINGKELFVSLLITNKNILLFQDLKKNSGLSGREMYIVPEYDLFQKISLHNLKYKIDNDDTLINDNIILYNLNIDEYVK